jgi:hypothetical protein
MIGITGLVDTLLAAKLSQRLDQLSLNLKPDVELPAPEPAIPVQKAANDVRLPSRAALDAQIAGRGSAPAQAPAAPSSDARLSDAARVITSVLADPQAQAQAGPVRGTAPVWTSLEVPATGALAASLANTLSASGLFYESHLLQLAAGQRSPGELAQEPLARLPVPMPLSRPAAGPAVPLTDADAHGAMPPSHAAPVAQVVHPQAVALVHQQLDLLATGVFRWSGEAWPGVPMEWSVHEEEPDGPDAKAPRGEALQRRWTTTMSLDLPRLGRVDVHLSLSGAAVHAALTANDAAVLARLRDAGGGLVERFESAGLRLDELKIAPRAQS